MTVPAVDQKAIAEAVRILDAGGLVAMPTETVYGLAADADNEEAVLNTYRAKGRKPKRSPDATGPDPSRSFSKRSPAAASG